MLQSPLFVNAIGGVLEIYTRYTSLRPQQGLVFLDWKVDSSFNGEAERFRRPLRIEPYSLRITPFNNLNKLDRCPVSKTVESTQNFLFFEFCVLVYRNLPRQPTKIPSLVDFEATRENGLHFVVREVGRLREAARLAHSEHK